MRSVSIIIPAHNEEAVIERCLHSLVAACTKQKLRVWVIANACTDDTANKAKAFGSFVTVIETEIPSKVNALNLGDEAAVGYPRFYIDADVTLSPGSLDELCQALSKPQVLAAAPRLRVDLTNRPWSVRAFYRVWQQLPYCRTGMIGSGFYGLSEEGRKRFGLFPDIIADDAFVRLQFTLSERKTVDSCYFTIVPPKSIAKVIEIKTRSHYGNAELKKKFSGLWKYENASNVWKLITLAWKPAWWLPLAVYFYVRLTAGLRALKRNRHGEVYKWERDDSSREQPT